MSWFTQPSIKRKLTWIIIASSGAALLVASTAFVAYDYYSFRRNVVQELSELADVLGYNCVGALSFSLQEDPVVTNVLASVRGVPGMEVAWIQNNGTNLYEFSTGKVQADPIPIPEHDFGHYFTSRDLFVYRPIFSDKDGSFFGHIVLRSNLDRFYIRLHQYVGLVAVVLLLALIVALLTSAWLQGLISRPILALAKTARRVSEKKDYSVRANQTSQDEVGTLIGSFNEMLDTLQQRDRQLREARDAADRANRAKSDFLSFMSHELRTPLTSIIGFSEVLLTEMEAERQ